MLIDWFTVGAQAINFLILVWLLKRFLYRPVLAAIDARERKIAAQLAGAAQTAAQARAQSDDFQQRSEALERDRERILRSAAAEAAAERQRLLEAARQESQALRARLTEVVTQERNELRHRLVTQTQAEVVALARKVLTDLAGVDIEERMVEAFIENLRRLPKDQRHWHEALRRSGPDATSPTSAEAMVRSAFDLSPSRQATIRSAVNESMGADIEIGFQVSPDLLCGIDLRVNGMKLAWSVADYLDCVSQELLALTEVTWDAGEASMEARHG